MILLLVAKCFPYIDLEVPVSEEKTENKYDYLPSLNDLIGLYLMDLWAIQLYGSV